MKWWELADKFVTDYQDGGSRTAPKERTVPADWLQQQSAIGTRMVEAPATPAAPVKKGRAEGGKGVAAICGYRTAAQAPRLGRCCYTRVRGPGHETGPYPTLS